MRYVVALILMFTIASGCDTAPGPALLDERSPVLEDFNFVPQRIVYALLPDSQVDGDSIRVPLSISVTVHNHGTPIDEVRYAIQPSSALDDPVLFGVLPPVGNNRYEDDLLLTLSALDVQTYTVLVFAVDQSARVSGDARGSLHYFRSFEPGSPPVIEGLQVPDSLRRPPPGQPAATLLLIARVHDVDGQSDIALMEFWNVNAPATRLLMCDDGGVGMCGSSQDSGDMAAGDSFYTRRVFITSDNAAGVTTLSFQATDRAGLQSDVVSHDVLVL